jgi:hypothetical protein
MANKAFQNLTIPTLKVLRVPRIKSSSNRHQFLIVLRLAKTTLELSLLATLIFCFSLTVYLTIAQPAIQRAIV